MMQKLRFKKVDKLIFQDRLDNGLRVLITPMPNLDKVKFGINLSIGGYPRDYFIDKVRILPGTPALLVEALKLHPSELAKPLFDGICEFNTKVYESYISFEVKCEIADTKKYLTSLLHLFDELTITNDELEALKVKYASTLKENMKDSEVLLRDALYLSSPMKYSPLGTLEGIKGIHLPAIKKFFNKFFSNEYLTLFVLGNLNPNDVFDLVKLINIPKRDNGVVLVKDVKEDYLKVNSQLSYLNTKDSLILGVKFPKREDITTKYKSNNFAYYTLLQHLVFSKINPLFVSDVKSYDELGSNFIKEGAEDAFFYQEFKTQNPDKLYDELQKFLLKTNFVSFFKFNKMKKELLKYFKNLYKTDIDTCYDRLLASFANDFADTAIVELACKAKYATFMDFYKDFLLFPRAYLISKK